MLTTLTRRAGDMLRRFVPRRIREWQRAWDATRPLHPRRCPICGFEGYFQHAGRPPRIDALCPACGSMERHRFQWLYLRDARLDGPIVHLAAEPCLERKLRERFGSAYRTADLFRPADLKLDLEGIALADGSLGGVICNHVLEHVDDRRALAELHRVLRPGGKMVCSVPIVYGWSRTYENASITHARDRELHFGQDDHVRFYGRDFADRLRAAGFLVDERTAEEPECVAYGLQRGDKFYVATRPA